MNRETNRSPIRINGLKSASKTPGKIITLISNHRMTMTLLKYRVRGRLEEFSSKKYHRNITNGSRSDDGEQIEMDLCSYRNESSVFITLDLFREYFCL